jgi:hypothetical protein
MASLPVGEVGEVGDFALSLTFSEAPSLWYLPDFLKSY